MGNGEWGVGNEVRGCWEVGNGEWGVGNEVRGCWEVGNGEWGVGNEVRGAFSPFPFPIPQSPLPTPLRVEKWPHITYCLSAMATKYCPTCQKTFTSTERLCPNDHSVLS